jgi:hypothetical protein
VPQPIRYRFSQHFSVPARQAYKWCTNFDSQDHVLMHDDAQRQVTPISEGTIILTDIFHTSKGHVEKQKLVQLYPNQLSWISTHLTGPNRYSQFIYEISAKGKNASVLNFNALHLEYEKEDLNKSDIKLLADKLKKEDSAAWKLLAEAMQKELRH